MIENEITKYNILFTKKLFMYVELIGFITVQNLKNANDTRRNGYNKEKFNEIENAQKHTKPDFH